MTDIKKADRYSLIDAIRAAAIINMVLYHLCYDIFCVFGVWTGFYRAIPVIIWERFICCTFNIVSGMSMNFSRHGYRHGIITNLCGFLITIVTVLVMPEQAIRFGVLNLLGCAMLITFALRRELSRLPEAIYRFRWLAFLGFPPNSFYSADYFPIIPWIFLYLFGFELWRWIADKGFDRFFRLRIPVLDFIGRHSLSIYLIHQPLLYGVCWLIFRFIT